MTVRVQLPYVLRAVAGGRREVVVPAAPSLRVLVDRLEAAHPGMRAGLLDARGQLQGHLIVFVDGTEVRRAGSGLDTPVPDGAEVTVLQAMSGGAPTCCAECGTPSPEAAKFCAECGARLTEAAAAVRKTVTVVFCDIVGSTAIGERLDPEAQRTVLTRFFTEMRRVLESHGGTVEKFIGDAVMAVFGVPVAHEDDALRAVRAAAGMQDAVRSLGAELGAAYGVELSARIGVNTGEVVVGDGAGGTVATGAPVNIAARLEQSAEPGEVLLGEATYRLVRGAVVAAKSAPLPVKGATEPIAAWRLVSAPPGTGRVERLTDEVPFVGRERELRLLHDGFDRAVEQRICQVFTLLGEAGSGKTRLVQQFVEQLDDAALVLQGHCLPYGEGIAFHPLLELLRSAAGLTGGEDPATARRRLADLLPDVDRELLLDRLAPLAGLPGRPPTRDDTYVAVRRWVEALARARPLVLVIEDVHWAEPALLDLLEHVTDLVRDVPVVVMCVARPEFVELRPTWVGGALNAATVHLTPMPDADVTLLMGELLPGAPIAPAVVCGVAEVSQGNPLFVGQLVAMLREDDVVRLVDGVWTAPDPIEQLHLPPSISALLTARLDRLGSGERALLEAASVMGVVFYPSAVDVLLDSGTPAEAGDRPADRADGLIQLVRKDLLRPAESDIAGEDAYRFLHALVREAAYAALPKAARAAQHERFARWLDTRAGRGSAQVDEFVAYHLEQSCLLRLTLGPLDDDARATAAEASRRLAAAARRLQSGDPRSAASLLHRAVTLALDPRERAAFTLKEGEALYEAGDLPAAVVRMDDAGEQARRLGDDVLALTATLDRVYLAVQSGEPLDLDEVLRLADDADRRFRPEEHPDLFLASCIARITVLNVRAQWGPLFPVACAAVEHARSAGSLGWQHWFESFRVRALAVGPIPVDDALTMWDRFEAESGETAVGAVTRLGTQARLLAMADRADEARAALQRCYEQKAELRPGLFEPVQLQIASDVERTLGDVVAAERSYRQMVEWLERHGEQAWLSTYAADYAALFLDGIGVDRARRYLALAKAATRAEDVASQAACCSLEAMLLSREGRRDEARGQARQALDWVARSDQLVFNGMVRLRVADVLRAAGDDAAATETVERALADFTRKGDVPDARRAGALLAHAPAAS